MPRPQRNFPASMLPPPPMAGAMAAPQRQAMMAANLDAATTEAPWVNQMQQPPMMQGGVPGRQGMNEAAALHAAALAANAPGGTPAGAPNMPPDPMIALNRGAAGAPPVAQPAMPPRPGTRPQMGPGTEMMRNLMLGGGVGAATNSPIGLGVGAGLGGLATYLARRKKSPVGAGRKAGPPAAPNGVPPDMQDLQYAKGGVVKAGVKPPLKKPAPKPKPGNRPPAIKLAAGGAAKERKGFPHTTPPPRMKGNPVMRGMGAATRGHNFKGVY